MDEVFETRYEWLRPGQLIERYKQCPLVILSVAPLEYHGPHLPLGTDAINATRVAHATCRKLRKGVVMPTLFAGTERERDPDCLKALGFKPTEYVVGMDFPTRLWNSHYLPEEIFALIISAELKILVKQGYRYIFIANGHGAVNQRQVLERLCIEYSNNTSGAKVDSYLTLDERVIEDNSAGHADIIETSLLMNYELDSVDLSVLPEKGTQIKYTDFSIVDGIGFTPKHDPEHIVRYQDPRDSTVERGRELFKAAVEQLASRIERLIAS
ncbi:MAG: creatininase family protein [Planctomycetota bacterium]